MEILRLLAKPAIIKILILLSTGPRYPRAIASTLGKSEAFVVRCLKSLERHGLVESSWTRVGGRNVKIYRLRTNSLTLEFAGGGVSVRLGGEGDSPLDVVCEPEPPRAPSYFVDREAELEALLSAAGVSVVWGPPGVGKTALAARLFELHKGPKAWVTCDAHTDLHVLAGGVARAAGLRGPPPRLESEGDLRALALRLSEARGLLVLDDFHRVGSEVIDSLYVLDEAVVEGRIVILSRAPIPMAPSRGRMIPLASLDKSSSLALLRELGLSLGEGEAAWIYEATEGNPRLLVAAAKVVEASGFDEDRIGEVLEALMTPVISSLGKHEYEVLKAASVFREPAPIAAVAKVSSVKTVRVYLAALERRELVRVVGGRVRVHPIVRRLLERREGARLAKYHSLAAGYQLSEGRVMAALYHLIGGRRYSEALEVLEELYESYRVQREDSRVKSLLSEIDDESLSPLERARLTCLKALFSNPGHALKALEAAAVEARRWRDKALMARAFQLIGEGHASRGDYAAASEYAALAAVMLRRAGFPTPRLVDDVFSLLAKLGRLKDASELAEHYLRSARAAPARANAVYWLGVIRALAGDLEAAEEKLRESAKSLAEACPTKASRAYQYLAYICARAGRVDEALRYDDEALRAATNRLDKLLSLLSKSLHLAYAGDASAAEELMASIEENYGPELEAYVKAKLLYSLAKAHVLASKGLVEEAVSCVERVMGASKRSNPLLYITCLLEYPMLAPSRAGRESMGALTEAGTMLEELGEIASSRRGLRRERNTGSLPRQRLPRRQAERIGASRRDPRERRRG
ncbi:MAG: hypothetical protein DRK00_07335 [Thermoprotei archaeon]|nr:MAG: hypothetical protein DRK00_07335 [Thermoprotei archaeon]